MQVIDESILEFMNKRGIFKTPFVQRKYEWKEEIDELIDDTNEIDFNDPVSRTHDLQEMLVEKKYNPNIGKNGMYVYIIWDGQQRFITNYLEVIAICKSLKKAKNESWKIYFEEYLINSNENEENWLKVSFSKQVNSVISKLVENVYYDKEFNANLLEKNKVYSAYQTIDEYFSSKSPEFLEDYLKKMNGLIVYFKYGEDTDNMPKQFRLSNKRGRQISEYTNLKSCLLPKPEDELPIEHIKLFEEMEEKLELEDKAKPHTRLENFMKCYLSHKTSIDKSRRWSKNFEKYIKRYCNSDEDYNNLLEDIRHKYKLYLFVNGIEFDDNCPISLKNSILHFNKLNTDILNKFLLECAVDYEKGFFSADDFIEIFDFCSNYMIRMYCCGSTESASTLLNRLHDKGGKYHIDTYNYVNSIKSLVLNHENLKVRFPSNNEFRNGFINKTWSIATDYYKFVEISIQNHLADKKHQDIIKYGRTKQKDYCHSTDHIFAQSFDELCISELAGGETEANKIKDSYMNNIGNLIPTLYNSEMGKLPFGKKREWYVKDGLEATKKLLGYKKWGIDEIKSFANWKFDVILERYPMAYVDRSQKYYNAKIGVMGAK